MSDEITQGKTKWDLRQAKLELLGTLVQEKSLSYRDLIKNKNRENLRDFFQEFQVVYKEVKQFASKNNDKHQDLIESIDEKKSSLDDKLAEQPGIDDFEQIGNTVKVFQEVDEADDKLRELQMAVGLDIPLTQEREGFGQKDKMNGGGD